MEKQYEDFSGHMAAKLSADALRSSKAEDRQKSPSGLSQDNGNLEAELKDQIAPLEGGRSLRAS